MGARAVVEGYLRPGVCGTGHGLEGFIRKLMAESRHPAADTLFRLDKGLTSGAVLDCIEELKAGYVGKLKLSPAVAGRSRGSKNGVRSAMATLPPIFTASSTSGAAPGAWR